MKHEVVLATAAWLLLGNGHGLAESTTRPDVLTVPVASNDGPSATRMPVALQDGVEVYIFVASSRGQDLGYDGPHRLTGASAIISIAEYRRRVVQQFGSEATVRSFRTNGSGTCLYAYRNERR